MEPINVETMPNDLAINWSDGHETFIDFVTLRNACPCAACKGEPHLWGKTTPTIDSSKLPAEAFELMKINGMGNYALQFEWGDRHDTGIYTYDLLRVLCQCEECNAKRAS